MALFRTQSVNKNQEQNSKKLSKGLVLHKEIPKHKQCWPQLWRGTAFSREKQYCTQNGKT